MTVEGSCDPAFGEVRDVFAANLADGLDLGAAVAVYVDGRPVVDLWGGLADARTGRAWQRETACVTFSATKAVTATAALLLAERGAVQLDRPVTDWWPEYGARGKQDTTAEHLLTHRAGLPAFDRPVDAEQAADPVAMAAQLAGQAPEWVPGTEHGYHAITFGWLAGELVRRHAGTTVGEFVRAQIDPQLWVGVPPAMLAGLARLAAAHGDPLNGGRGAPPQEPAAPPEVVARLLAALRDPDSPSQRAMANPAVSFNNPALLTAGWPAAGLVCTARALAGFYARLSRGEILRPETVRDAVRERVRGPDRTLVLDSAFGLGYMLPCANMFLPAAARPSAFGHPGASGALGLGDLQRQVAIGYVPNLNRPLVGDRRSYHLVRAIYDSL